MCASRGVHKLTSRVRYCLPSAMKCIPLLYIRIYKKKYFVQFYVSVVSGQKSQIWFLLLHVCMRMVWYENVFYSCKIYDLLLPLPVVFESTRHSVTDSLVLGEETIRSSALSSSESQASKFYLQMLHSSHGDSSLTKALRQPWKL